MTARSVRNKVQRFRYKLPLIFHRLPITMERLLGRGRKVGPLRLFPPEAEGRLSAFHADRPLTAGVYEDLFTYFVEGW